jgi:hypothetical protein
VEAWTPSQPASETTTTLAPTTSACT